MPKGKAVTIRSHEEETVTAYVTYPHWQEALENIIGGSKSSADWSAVKSATRAPYSSTSIRIPS